MGTDALGTTPASHHLRARTLELPFTKAFSQSTVAPLGASPHRHGEGQRAEHPLWVSATRSCQRVLERSVFGRAVSAQGSTVVSLSTGTGQVNWVPLVFLLGSGLHTAGYLSLSQPRASSPNSSPLLSSVPDRCLGWGGEKAGESPHRVFWSHDNHSKRQTDRWTWTKGCRIESPP